MCYNNNDKALLKVERLKIGDTIGLVAPSSSLKNAIALDEAVSLIKSKGYDVKVGASCGAKYGYLSGDDELRSADINDMFRDGGVKAIVCLNGGYGVTRLLDRLDYAAIANNPKLVVGYSDITALHAANYARCGLCGLHAPMPAYGIDEVSEKSLKAALSDEFLGKPLSNPDNAPITCVNPGRAEGALVGGNLSLIACAIGTGYMPDVTGKLLLIEEVNEYTYAVDRMLTHLRLAGVFERCAGVVFGSFTKCESEYPDRPMSLESIISDVVAPCKKPIISGLQIGHCRPAISVALGVRYSLDAERLELKPVESMFYD